MVSADIDKETRLATTPTPTLDIVDVNEYHALVDGKAYRSFSPVAITRVTYGTTHVDTQFSAAVDQMNAGGLAARGFYAFCTATGDYYAQGVFFAKTLLAKIGQLARTDFVSWDIESGVGDLSTAAEQFMAGVHSVMSENPAQDWGYSGAAFWTAHLGSVNGVHRWIASYGVATEPAMGEDLWQRTDAQAAPGVEGLCDCSRFYGTLAQFLALIDPAGVVANLTGGEMIPKLVKATNVATGKTAQYAIRAQDVLWVTDGTTSGWAYNEFNGGQGDLESVPWEVILWWNGGQVPTGAP